MARSRSRSRAVRGVVWLGVGLGALAPAGCGESGRPTVKPGDSSTTYTPPPPPENAVSTSGKAPRRARGQRGTMSARELRDFRQKQQPAP